MTPWRSRPYLDLVYLPGVRCAKCGRPRSEDNPIDPAHISGLYSDGLGKGGGQKAADLVVAPLCRQPCHRQMDEYAAGNDEARAAWFLAACWRWLLQMIAAGHVTLEVHTAAVQRDTRPSRERRRRKQFSTAAPLKSDGTPAIVPRGNRIV